MQSVALLPVCTVTSPNNALQLTASSLRFAALRSGFRQQLKAGVRRLTFGARIDKMKSF